MEEKHGLRHTLQDKVENLWLQFKLALKNYNETTEERKTAFETLKKKDDESAKEIDTQMRRLQRISVRQFIDKIILVNIILQFVSQSCNLFARYLEVALTDLDVGQLVQ